MRTPKLSDLKMMAKLPATFLKRAIGVKGYKKGGKVSKTGLAYLHKGEVVRPKVSKKVKKKMGFK